MLKEGVYACLGAEGSSTARRSTGVAPQTPILPKRKQTQGTINNKKTTNAMHTHVDMQINASK